MAGERRQAAARRSAAARDRARGDRLFPRRLGLAAARDRRMAASAAAARDAMNLPEYWDDAARELAKRDPVLSKLTTRYPGLTLGSRGDAFSTLARAIVGQQISVKAAQSVWDRLLAEVTSISAANVLSAELARLRSCGLSGQKCAYLLDLAQRFASGTLDPAHWIDLDDEALIVELTQVKGIGRWTA